MGNYRAKFDQGFILRTLPKSFWRIHKSDGIPVPLGGTS